MPALFGQLWGDLEELFRVGATEDGGVGATEDGGVGAGCTGLKCVAGTFCNETAKSCDPCLPGKIVNLYYFKNVFILFYESFYNLLRMFS